MTPRWTPLALLAVLGCEAEPTRLSLSLTANPDQGCACDGDTDLSCLTHLQIRFFDEGGGVALDRCVPVPEGTRTFAQPQLGGLFEATLEPTWSRVALKGYRGACAGPVVFSAEGALGAGGALTLAADCAFQCEVPKCDRKFCFGNSEALDALRAPDGALVPRATGAALVGEGEDRWLYLGTDRFSSPSLRMARVRMRDAVTPDMSTLEPSPVDVFSGTGTTLPPRISPDGLEMYFGSTRDVASWDKSFLHIATRDAVTEEWGAPQLMTFDPPYEDGVFHAVLLHDGRTILYRRSVSHEIHIARRDGAVRGETHFRHLGRAHFENADQYVILSIALSCDGHHLLYTRGSRDPAANGIVESMAVRITSLDPVDFGVPIPLEDLPLGNRDDQQIVWELFEAPDCSGLYYSNERSIFFKPKVSCD